MTSIDLQNDILDRLGSTYTIEMLRNDFGGKTMEQVAQTLRKWFPGEDNDQLAQNIFDYLKYS